MTAIEKLTDDEFNSITLKVIGRELGPLGVARFLHLNRMGSGDYTAKRRKLHKGLTVDSIAASIQRRRERESVKP